MSARASRRQVLAAIALADAPMPEAVKFREYERDGQTKHYIDLDLASIADLRAWLPFFGITEKAISTQPYMHKTGRETGQATTLAHALRHDNGWRGWSVDLSALDPVGEPDAPLDDATREQLATIAAAPVREDLGALFATIAPDLPIVTAIAYGAALTEAGYQVIKAGEAR